MATDESASKQAVPFDATAAAEGLCRLADMAEQHGAGGAPLDHDLAHQAFASLQAAQEWLEARLVDFDIRIQRPLVAGNEDPDRIGLDALVCTLRQVAVALVQVHKLLDLRGPRRR